MTITSSEAEALTMETLRRMETRYGGPCRRYRVTSVGEIVTFPSLQAAFDAKRDLRKIFSPEVYGVRLTYLSCDLVENGQPVRLLAIRSVDGNEWYVDASHFASIVNTI